MKFDKNDVNTQLGVLLIGLFFTNLGYFANKYIKDTSLAFFNGLKDGVCAGLMIVGVFLFIYGLINVIRITKNSK